MLVEWTMDVLEKSKSAVKFHLYADGEQQSGPCGITMHLSTFEDFCMHLGIAYDIAE